jgi:hypothetical protein
MNKQELKDRIKYLEKRNSKLETLIGMFLGGFNIEKLRETVMKMYQTGAL